MFGCFIHCRTPGSRSTDGLSVIAAPALADVSFYLNPVRDELVVHLGYQGPAGVAITNALGMERKRVKGRGRILRVALPEKRGVFQSIRGRWAG